MLKNLNISHYDQKEFIKLAQEGDEKALEEVINHNYALIYSILKRFHYRYEEEADLLSSGKLGLITAIKNYDLSLNNEFSTYAFYLIMGEIRKYFRDNKLISISRSIKENYKKIMSLKDLDFKSTSLNDISSLTNLTKEEVLVALEANQSVTSLDNPLQDNDDLTLIDVLKIEEKEDDIDLNVALGKLNKKEKLLIELRYYEGLSQSEVGKRLFMSQVQVSRYEKKILETLKSYILDFSRQNNS